jgi:4'-phosphopantetheinyl transferase
MAPNERMTPLSANEFRNYIFGTTLACEFQEAEVWLLSTRVSVEQRPFYERVLSAEEHRRTSQFHYQRDKDRFIVGRGALRWILSSHCGTNAEKVQFYLGKRGKPFLREPSSAIEFNVSHAGDCVLIGITNNAKCGVDIEQAHRNTSEEEIAQRYFCPQEFEWMKRSNLGFVRLWTMKEAITKAVGEGLSIPLAAIDVSSVAEGNTSQVFIQTNGLEGRSVWVKELDVIVGYIASIAVVGNEHTIRLIAGSGLYGCQLDP